jgi:hypothetical protein
LLKGLTKTLLYTCFTVLLCNNSLVFAQEDNKQDKGNIEKFDPILEDSYWINSFHQSVSNSVYQSAAWFDNFFTDKEESSKDLKTNARISFGWKPQSGDFNNLESRFRIKVKLPNFENKVDLIFSDDSEIDQSLLPLETVTTQTEIKEESFSAAMRYIHKKEKNQFTDTRLGISGGDVFLQARHKRRLSWNNNHDFKIEPSLYYFINDGLGSRLLLEYNYQQDQQKQFRVNYSIRGSESFKGIRWKHGFYRLNQLDERSASIIAIQVQGERNGDLGFIVDKYTLSYRYRFNKFQKWLYFEVEPFLEWSNTGNYVTSPGIALRIEGHFYKG